MSAFEKDSLKRKTDIFLPRLVAQTALVYFSREATYQTFVRWTAPLVHFTGQWTSNSLMSAFVRHFMNKSHWRHQEYSKLIFNDR
ncbi:hypothetical protein T11_17688 [Trichinella zimbabwensis]|uniref:Uncharacterized protein n=1 Tax=Trichinella zimbabwensis TaxID=268475 RepID=A0A0V1HJU0_9BILA|nr:hypothetical protein T11_3415 [Trichinella zimbabwensis]KRZ11027.1 hypothetical protein T11_4892 [Trichinella zimbabwensis]KRZ11045.1 hypothetical protein T11_17688 [Trichinella zimbabwensis]